jgi:hypothetical protein
VVLPGEPFFSTNVPAFALLMRASISRRGGGQSTGAVGAPADGPGPNDHASEGHADENAYGQVHHVATLGIGPAWPPRQGGVWPGGDESFGKAAGAVPTVWASRRR